MDRPVTKSPSTVSIEIVYQKDPITRLSREASADRSIFDQAIMKSLAVRSYPMTFSPLTANPIVQRSDLLGKRRSMVIFALSDWQRCSRWLRSSNDIMFDIQYNGTYSGFYAWNCNKAKSTAGTVESVIRNRLVNTYRNFNKIQNKPNVHDGSPSISAITFY